MKKLLLLPLFIFCLGIFVLNINVADAYTWDEFYEFCYNNQGNSSLPYQNSSMSNFVTIAYYLKTCFINNGYDPDNYNTFVCYITYYNQYYNIRFIMVQNADSFQKWNSNSRFQFNNTTDYVYYSNNLKISQIAGSTSSFTHGSGTYKDNNCEVNSSIGLFENASSTFLSQANIFAQNYYNGITSNDVTITSSSTIPFNLQQGIVGLSYDINNISYKLYSSADTFISDLTAVYTSTNSGKSMNLLLDTFTGITTGIYKINMYDSGSLIYTSPTFTITKFRDPIPGEITNNSGDVTGKVDLSATNQKLDDINNSIKSGDLAIISSIKDLESGEKARDDFWKQTYNNLFSLDSGDIEDIYNGIKSEFSSGDFVFEYYKPIYDVFDREPGDFVIRWDPISLNLTAFNGASLVSGEVIPSGDVNFSKLCRDNETLGYIKSLLNLIMGFSFLFLLIFEYYKTLLYCLGVGSELVGDMSSYESSTVDIDSEVAHVTTLPTGERRVSLTHSFGTSTRRRH